MNESYLHIDKSTLRKVFLEYRRTLEPSEYERRNSRLCEQLFTFIIGSQIHSVHVFLSIRRNLEPDIQPLFSDLRETGCRIICSKTDFRNRRLEHFSLEQDTSLELNRLGIPEPVDAVPVSITDAELILVPLVMADKKGNRIGYGGGFYDQLLADSHSRKIGLCLSPLLDEIPYTDSWDVKLDHVITPFE